MGARFDLILFDADDTLLDFSASEQEAFRACFGRLVPEVDAHAAYLKYQTISRSLWRDVERGVLSPATLRVRRWENLATRLGVTFPVAQVGETFIELFSQQTHLVDGAPDICARLSRDHALGVVTNGFETVQAARLNASQLRSHFDFLVTSEAVGAPKPSPRPFLRALEMHGREIPRDRVLMVGDSQSSDVAGGQNMGFATCWFDRAGEPTTGTVADYRIQSLHELVAIAGLEP